MPLIVYITRQLRHVLSFEVPLPRSPNNNKKKCAKNARAKHVAVEYYIHQYFPNIFARRPPFRFEKYPQKPTSLFT